MKALKKWGVLALDVVLAAAAIWVVWRIIHEYTVAELTSAILSLPWWALLTSVALTAMGYMALVGYDFLALHMVRHPLPPGKVIGPSFISFAVANNAPVSVLTGGGLRYRLYRGFGLSARKMAKVAALDVLTFVLGLATIAGITFETSPMGVPHAWDIPLFATVQPIGFILLLAVAIFLVLAAWHRRMCIFDHRIELPSLKMAVAEIIVSGFDWLLSSGALYVLLRSLIPLNWGHFLASFLLAQIATQVIPVPGGLGAFEAIVLLLRPAGVAAPPIFAGLVAYRVIYYFLPLIVAGVLLMTTHRSLLRRARGEEAPASAEEPRAGCRNREER